MKDIKKAGIVVHVIFLICANKSTFNIEDAMFVVSESGDILSPKKAPETIAPAVIGSDTSIALDIPIKATPMVRSEEHTSELQSRGHLVCRLLLEKKKKQKTA